MQHFTNESMLYIIDTLKEQLIDLAYDSIIEIEVLNPDMSDCLFAGELIEINEILYTYRSYKVWIDLAELLYCKVLTPKMNSKETIVLRLKKLNQNDSFHNSTIEKREKYGIQSSFFHINKNEEPSYLWAYLNALNNVNIHSKQTILNLGINKADEFDVIEKLLTKEKLDKKEFYGIDFSPSVISIAKKKFPNKNFHFICEDLNNIDNLNLPKIDLLISVGTLQSSSLNFKPYFTSLVQNHLAKEGAIILGFPNTRWINKEMIYGAKTKNYADSELSLLFKDIYFCKKYLQQKKYKVMISGKNYIFLSAFSINQNLR